VQQVHLLHLLLLLPQPHICEDLGLEGVRVIFLLEGVEAVEDLIDLEEPSIPLAALPHPVLHRCNLLLKGAIIPKVVFVVAVLLGAALPVRLAEVVFHALLLLQRLQQEVVVLHGLPMLLIVRLQILTHILRSQ